MKVEDFKKNAVVLQFKRTETGDGSFINSPPRLKKLTATHIYGEYTDRYSAGRQIILLREEWGGDIWVKYDPPRKKASRRAANKAVDVNSESVVMRELLAFKASRDAIAARDAKREKDWQEYLATDEGKAMLERDNTAPKDPE